MFRINLERQLLSQNTTLHTPEELLRIKEYDRLSNISNDPILKRLGLTETVTTGKVIKQNVQYLQRETLKYDQERVFHISQIEKLCEKYHLKFDNANQYEGQMDLELPLKLNTFEVAHGIKLEQYNSFIMAPPKSFKLEEKPDDPLFFYQINEHYYYLIHKWGNDIHWTRRILSFFSTRFGSFLFCLLLLASNIIPLIISVNTFTVISSGVLSVLSVFIIGLIIDRGAVVQPLVFTRPPKGEPEPQYPKTRSYFGDSFTRSSED